MQTNRIYESVTLSLTDGTTRTYRLPKEHWDKFRKDFPEIPWTTVHIVAR